ncbi:MAG TPA: hypothetical protein VG347_20060 [Verrucomicrobiae bacterium]|nr:hypothetical protein [Verrucomicrobiae bacterium]
MSEVIKWRDLSVDVQARLVPRFLWTTASIAVFVGGQRMLRAGGQFKFTGSHSAAFTHDGSSHTAKLTWGSSGLSSSFPYQLKIDDVLVSASRVRIQNRAMVLAGSILISAAVTTALMLVHYFAGHNPHHSTHWVL